MTRFQFFSILVIIIFSFFQKTGCLSLNLCTNQPQVANIYGVTKGFFSSDINPHTGEYYPMQRCTWNITVRQHARIRILELVPPSFYRSSNESVLPYSEPCGMCDRVTIYDGPNMSPSTGRILESFCGNNGTGAIIKPINPRLTTSNTAIVHFCTDFRLKNHPGGRAKKYRGFTVHFDEVLTPRAVVASSLLTIITSPTVITSSTTESASLSTTTTGYVYWATTLKWILSWTTTPKQHDLLPNFIDDDEYHGAGRDKQCGLDFDPTAIVFGIVMGIIAVSAVAFLISIWIKEERLWTAVAKAAQRSSMYYHDYD